MSFHVSVIDDDADLRNLMQIALKLEGFDVTTYQNGAEFLEGYMANPRSQCYVIDINLGGITGAELCKKLKSDTNSKDSYVILISANPEVEYLAAESGADSYMLKPFSQKELIKRLTALTL